jgi:hypothetical protein
MSGVLEGLFTTTRNDTPAGAAIRTAFFDWLREELPDISPPILDEKYTGEMHLEFPETP